MKIRRRNLAIFTASALASGWLGAGLNKALGQPNTLDSPGAGLWLVMPLATTVGLRIAGSGWRKGGWSPRLPSALPSYAVGVLAYPAVTAGVLLLGRGLGLTDTSGFDLKKLTLAFLPALGVNLVKNFFEESVWRGYLTEELLEERPSDLALYLGVGAVWSLWHLPYYLVFLDEPTMRSVVDLPRPAATAVLCATMIGWTVLYSELYRLSGSIWPCVLMHAVEDALINPIVLDGHAKFTPGGAFVVSPIVGIATTAAHIGVGLGLRALRRRRSGARVG